MKSKIIAAVFLLSILSVSGCGSSESSSSQEDQAKDAVTGYLQAVKDKNGEEFCLSVSSDNIDSMLEQIKTAGIKGLEVGTSCADVMNTVFDLSTDTISEEDVEQVKEGLDKAEVTIEGNKATIELPEGTAVNDGDDTVNLVREDGTWKVNAEVTK